MQTKILFNHGWSFCKTPLGTEISDLAQYEAGFQSVELPHDWLIYDTENLYEDSCGWYRKVICLTKEEAADLQAGERRMIRFDGVYMNSTVYANKQKVGDWKYGYSTFDMDVTDFLTEGENEILVQVRYQSPNTRWYSGAGIYRNVWWKECGKTYLPLDGTYVNIRPVENDAAVPTDFVVEAETEVAGAVDENTVCRYSLWQGDELIKELGVQRAEKNCAKQSADGRENFLVKGSWKIANPKRWDIDAPECYELKVELLLGTEKSTCMAFELYDEQKITIGFRTMKFDAGEGFFLNGRNVKVHGVCEHHDFGALGAVFSETAMVRKFELLRGMGVNAIRTSHNMPAPELMELADRMGFLVMDEAFDMWERPKTKYDYGNFFKEWAERDVESWVRRDRNHPSLFLWSIGNEIYDTHADEHGQEITRRLIGYVRAHDPKENAAITIGSNYMPWENAQKCADIVKLAGYNYGEKYYDAHHAEHPDWVIYGSETASMVQSRGIYHFPLSQSILADSDEQCSALGNSATSWGAKSIEKCITDDRDAEYAFGQFLWTGFDYIGEPTPYHTKNSYFGQLDTAGFPKDAYYIFQAEWTDFHKNPMIHLFPYWDFNPGQMIDVRACTNAPLVELFVNGISQGRKELDHAHGKALLGDWKVPYEPGTITAVAYDENGNEVTRESRSSFGDSKKIILSADREKLLADGKDLCFITISTVDEQGNPVENAVDYVQVSVDGPGRLLGLDNGDSTDYDSYKGNVRKLFSGKLLAIVGATKGNDTITVKVSGKGLEPAEIELEAVACGTEILTRPQGAEASIRRFPVRKVELHAAGGQLLTKDCQETIIEARVYPAGAEAELIWKVVNDGGVPIDFATVEPLCDADGVARAKVTARGDGAFRVRCMAKESSDRKPEGKITVISQLELRAEGLGKAFLNPYGFISAGLYTETYGEVGNGNELGIATARDGVSGVIFEGVDFGEYGSDEITAPVFALSGDEYPIEIWLGKPFCEGSRLLDTVVYQKPSIWNTYQEETWKLPERIKGVATIAFLLKAKVHLKGFSFKYTEKAYGKLFAGENDSVYGDSFTCEGDFVTGIGNNVTLEFHNMDFGTAGTDKLMLCGSTPLAANTIHIHFTNEEGETLNRIVEFTGDGGEEQEFTFEKISGKGKVEFIFLPGSNFDFKYFRFS